MIEVYFIGGPLDLTKRAYPHMPVNGRITVVSQIGGEILRPCPIEGIVEMPKTIEETYFLTTRIAHNIGSGADVFVAMYNHPQYDF